ncbi:hypothetical protein BDB01DRAFT_803107 [Pilobolus umbonatus]|nr:hypothetical protein BDB01DRAFT_803107 [Pilobolus umbonatus]
MSIEDDSISVLSELTCSTTYSVTETQHTLPVAIDLTPIKESVFQRELGLLHPFQLSTRSNVFMLSGMSCDDLIRSIVEIWSRTRIHDRKERMMNRAWSNWVILDLCRRIEMVFKVEAMSQLMDMVADRLFCK